MTDPDLTRPPARTDDDAARASAESVQVIYAELAPELLDRDAEQHVDVVDPAEFAVQTVHAVLVCHDGARWLPRTLASLAQLTQPCASLVAVDTASRDSTPDLLAASPVVSSLLSLPRQTGFSAALAQAMAQLPAAHGSDAAGHEWIWVVHDDSAPRPDSLTRLLRAALTHDAAVVGPKVLDWDGSRRLVELGLSITGAGRRETGLERDERDQGQHDDRLDVLAVGTAGMLVRRDVWDGLAGLDPQIEFFRDDVDFGWRARLAGHRVVVAPDAVVEHAAAASSGRRRVVATRDRPPLVDRRNAVHVLLANARRWAFVPVLLRVVVGSLLRSIGFVVAKVPGVAWDEVVAVSGALRPGRLRQARRWRAQQPRSGDVSGLRPTLGTQLRHAVDNARNVVAGTAVSQDVPEARRRSSAAPDVLEPEQLVPSEPLLARVSGRPGVWLVSLSALLVLVSARTVLFGGRLTGGALLPAPDTGLDWWTAYLAGWHPVGLGSAVGAPPYLAVLAGLSVPVLGSASVVVSLLVLAAVPMATASAWWALRGLVDSLAVRLWAAATYGVVVLGTGAVAAGRLGTCVAAVLLPAVVRVTVRALQPGAPWRRTWAASVLLAVTTAFAPVQWPVAVVSSLGLLAYRRRWGSLGRLALLAAVPAVLLLPWLPEIIARPELLVMEAGMTGRGPELADPALPSWYPALLATGGPGSLAPGLLAGLALLALLSLVLVRAAAARLAWVLVLVALVAALVTSRVAVSTPIGQGVAAGWPGPAVTLAGLGMIVAAARAIEHVRTYAERTATVLAVGVLAVATTLVAGGAGLASGTTDPLDRRDPELLPAYIAAEASGPDRARTLVLRAPRATDTPLVQYSLLRQSSARLGDAELVSPDESTMLGETVADLISGRGAASTGRLASFAVRYVYAAPPTQADLVEALDGQPGLVRASAPDGGAVWRVDGTTARVRLLADDERADRPVGVAVPSGEVDVSTSIDSPGATSVVLAELFDPGWTATLDGEPLQSVEVDGLVGFDLPRSSGALTVTYQDPRRGWLLIGQAVALALVVMLAAPSLRGRRQTVEGSLL